MWKWCGSTATTTAPRRSSSHLLGVSVCDEYVLESGGKKVLFLHGHIFDEFIDNYPWATWFRGTGCISFLQKNRHLAPLRQTRQAEQ